MKKHIAFLLTAFLTLSTVPSFAFGADKDVILSNRVALKQDTVLTQANAPVLSVQANSVYTQDFRFELLLNGAEWAEEIINGSYSFGEGITYLTVGDSRLRISVDAKTYKPSENDIKLPLLTKLVAQGEIAVTLEPGTSSLEKEQFVYANTGGSEFSIETEMVPKLEIVGTLGDIVIKDGYLSKVNENTVYPLTLDNGFVFSGKPTIQTTGKYNSNIDFTIDPKDSSKASLTLTKTSDVGIGEIVLSDLQIRPEKTSQHGAVNLSLQRGKDTLKIQVAEYVSSDSTTLPVTMDTFTVGKKPSASGTAARDRLLQIRFDGRPYGTAAVATDGTWNYTFPSEKKALPVGKHTLSVGYYLKTSDTYTEMISQEFFIPTAVTFTIGQNSYLYDESAIFMGVAPYVDKNNRTMMPLRAFATVLGVDESGIVWNEANQTVTLKKDSTTLVVTIGSKELLVNGKPVTMDTVATINSSRTFLPLRAVMNGFSLTDDSIVWDEEAQTVTLSLTK